MAAHRVLLAGFLLLAAGVCAVGAEEPTATVSGALTIDGEVVSLPYVYVYAEEEGFYDPADPTWTVLFSDRPMDVRDLDGFGGDGAFYQVGFTRTVGFDEDGEPRLEVYTQSIRPTADYGGNWSGGDYPEITLDEAGPDRFVGRLAHPEPFDFDDHRVQADLTFSAPLSDPDAPIGDPLPADGGEPGRAYLAWTAAVLSGDLERIKALVPPEMAAELTPEREAEFREGLEFMQAMTPTDLKIVGGSSDGTEAILEVEGRMEGEKVSGEIRMVKEAGLWRTTSESWH